MLFFKKYLNYNILNLYITGKQKKSIKKWKTEFKKKQEKEKKDNLNYFNYTANNNLV